MLLGSLIVSPELLSIPVSEFYLVLSQYLEIERNPDTRDDCSTVSLPALSFAWQ